MLYLLEAKYTTEEKQSLYNTYATETDLLSAFETKLGQQMKDSGCKVELLIAFDHTGKIFNQAYHTKDDSIALHDRLVTVTADNEGEHSTMQRYDTALDAEAYYHINRGNAMADENVKAILTMIVNPTGTGMNDYWVRPIEPISE